MAPGSRRTPPPTRCSTESPFALLMGMMLDQQFPMERAFAGPAKVLERFGSLDPAAIAAADPEEFAALCAAPPAVHRFPGLDGRAHPGAGRARGRGVRRARRPALDGAASGAELMRRLQALPGFGKQKAQIFTALLAKQPGVRPDGWEAAAGDYAEPGSYRSVADVVDQESLDRVRAFKKEKKAAAQGPPPPEERGCGTAGGGLVPAAPHLFVNPESPRGHRAWSGLRASRLRRC